ncbi:MAG: DUF305 domain-containing protein [Coriobacteriia bacterium]|nr:DUF305 domain-containing protein [Coriobacteriia bacterium]
MRKRTIPVIATFLVIIGLAGMGVTMVYLNTPALYTGDVEGTGTFRRMTTGNMDAMFIEQMIPHHDDAIAMAELALTRAEHPEIKQLAEDIKRTQTAENAQMRGWYREWFDADVPESGGASGMMGRMMGGGVVDMKDLENAELFDKTFIEQMVPHHQMAIMMSQMAGSATGRPEMRELTQSIVKAQSTEITKMQMWYDEWYGR